MGLRGNGLSRSFRRPVSDTARRRPLSTGVGDAGARCGDVAGESVALAAAEWGLWGGDSCTNALDLAGAFAGLAGSGADDMRMRGLLSARASEFDLLSMSAAGCRTLRTDS